MITFELIIQVLRRWQKKKFHDLLCLDFMSVTDYNLFINCGGPKMRIDDIEYEGDILDLGTSEFYDPESGKWAYSSTGDFVDNQNPKFITANTTALDITKPELYMTARLSPLSLKYYGLCLYKGNYTVNLHFAEIMFTDDETYSSNGRRLFDVSIQVIDSLIKIFNHAGIFLLFYLY